MGKRVLLLLLLCFPFLTAYSQDESATDTPANTSHNKRSLPTKIFTATRIINSSSVTNLKDGQLDFRISHRFGRLSEGSQNFYGLDDATTRLGLDYGITKWLMVGIGHSTLNKEDDGFMKIRLLRQRPRFSPVAVSYFGGMSLQTTPSPVVPTGDKWLYRYRLYYTHQLLIARKFGDRISLQLMPTIVHYNIVDNSKYSNNTIALGAGGKIRISKRIAITGEYYYRMNNADMRYNGATTYNSASIGMEVESGGHVFQLMVTNSPGLTERTFIGQTTDNWNKGELHFGFNISRIFGIVKSKEPKPL
jgi:hypothetical protein